MFRISKVPAVLTGAILPVLLTTPLFDPVAKIAPIAISKAWAQDHGTGGHTGGDTHTGGGDTHTGGGDTGGGHSGGGGSGQHGGGKGSGKHAGKGPNPNCALQDGSGRGGFGAGRGGQHSGSGEQSAATLSSDVGVTGGGAGGERFVCPPPGSWHTDVKVFRRR